jgi:hypothetical protein
MKNKTEVESKTLNFDKAAAVKAQAKQSLRPMRSMMAVRSLKPKTGVATLTLMKTDTTASL